MAMSSCNRACFLFQFSKQTVIESYKVVMSSCNRACFLFQFSKQTVIESYISFIENFARAEKVLDDMSTKSSFQKFVEVSFVSYDHCLRAWM